MNASHAAFLRFGNDGAFGIGKIDAYSRRFRRSRGSRRCRRICRRLRGSRRRCGSCRRCRTLAAQDCRQFRHQVRYVDQVFRIAVADVVDHLLEGVNALKQRVDDVLTDFELFLSEHVEHVFHFVSELGDFVVAHRRGHALECVRISENLVEYRQIFGVVLKA